MATTAYLPRALDNGQLGDRNLFLVYVLLIWAVTIAGFGLEMAVKFAAGSLHYPLIVHAHAIAFVGWLSILTAQVALIRHDNVALHRRLGGFAIGLVPLMAMLAIATVIVTKTLKYGRPDTTFPFMSVQFANVLASTVLFTAGFYMRRSPGTHKRLMLMGTLVLTEPGIRRIVGYFLDGNFHDGFAPFMAETYAGTMMLMLGIAACDWFSRRRVNPAYVLALAWCLVNQLASTWLFYQPWWADFTSSLVRH